MKKGRFVFATGGKGSDEHTDWRKQLSDDMSFREKGEYWAEHSENQDDPKMKRKMRELADAYIREADIAEKEEEEEEMQTESDMKDSYEELTRVRRHRLTGPLYG